jgi:hypothetical protein
MPDGDWVPFLLVGFEVAGFVGSWAKSSLANTAQPADEAAAAAAD